jgi:hypothetical protein
VRFLRKMRTVPINLFMNYCRLLLKKRTKSQSLPQDPTNYLQVKSKKSSQVPTLHTNTK